MDSIGWQASLSRSGYSSFTCNHANMPYPIAEWLKVFPMKMIGNYNVCNCYLFDVTELNWLTQKVKIYSVTSASVLIFFSSKNLLGRPLHCMVCAAPHRFERWTGLWDCQMCLLGLASLQTLEICWNHRGKDNARPDVTIIIKWKSVLRRSGCPSAGGTKLKALFIVP